MALTYAHNPEILVMHRINAHTKIHMFQSKLISTVQYLAYQFLFYGSDNQSYMFSESLLFWEAPQYIAAVSPLNFYT